MTEETPPVVPPAEEVVLSRPGPPGWIWLVILGVLAAGIAIGWGASHLPRSAAKPAPAAAPPGAIAVKPQALVDWSEADGPAEAVYVADGLVLSLKGKTIADDQRVATLHVTGPGGATFDLDGEVGFEKAAMSFMVGRLDPSNPIPQVIAMSYTGGAHCCTSVQVLTLVRGGWRRIDLGTWDGEGLQEFPKDVDGDGRPDLEFYDNAFLYAFTSYADSDAPPQFFDIVGDKSVDVSAEPRLRKGYQAAFDRAAKGCAEHSNGSCAAYVANAVRMGRYDEAWPRMLAGYDRDFEWGLPSACRNQKPGQECAKDDEVKFATFPEALRWFLGETGYLPAMPLPPPPHAAGPGFDCGKADSDVLRLICADAGLAAQDRDLTALYARALLLVPDAAGVKRDEQVFLKLRDGAEPDREFLAGLYDGRLEALRHQIGE